MAPPRGSFDLESRLTFRISKLYSAITRGWRHVGDEHELPLREWRVLAAIAEAGRLSACRLVDTSPLDKASVSRAVRTLKQRSLVRSQPDAQDARVRVLSLTPAGRRTYDRVAPVSARRHRALLATLSRAEQRTLERLLDRLNRRAEELLQESESP